MNVMRNFMWLRQLMAFLPLAILGNCALAQEAAGTATPTINAADTAWMMVACALVLMMTLPGLALFYGGMVRKKNVLGIFGQLFAVAGVATVLWMVVLYSLAFTPGNDFIGGFDKVMLAGITADSLSGTIPESVFMMFQMTFAIITPALIVGGFAERMKFSAMLLFTAIWLVLVYAPICHMVWESTGLFFKMGAKDFAGGTVVHINAGVAGLVAAYVLGKRIGYGREAMPPHNMVLTAMGAGMLWVGWFGFNAGSALAANGAAGMAFAVTHIAAGAAALSWMFAEWIVRGKPSLLGLASGAISGLVMITPAAGFVTPQSALIMGLLGGVCGMFGATTLKRLLKADDSLDAFGIHGVVGIVGAILTGVFATEVEDMGAQVMTQIKATLFTVVYSGVVTFVILKAIDFVLGLRVTEEQEREGLDLSQHGERIE